MNRSQNMEIMEKNSNKIDKKLFYPIIFCFLYSLYIKPFFDLFLNTILYSFTSYIWLKKQLKIRYLYILFSPLPQRELSLHSSSSEKKSTIKLNHKTLAPLSLIWLKSSVKCGKKSILPPRKDWKKLIKPTKKKLPNKKLLILNNTVKLKRKRRKNTPKSNDFKMIVYYIHP